jgi:hypothetical protein
MSCSTTSVLDYACAKSLLKHGVDPYTMAGILLHVLEGYLFSFGIELTGK